MRRANFGWRVICVATFAADLFLIASSSSYAAIGCVYGEDDLTIWQRIGLAGADQMIGTFVLFGFLIALISVGLKQCRVIAAAVSQSRLYQSRVLNALFYNRLDEAASVAALYPMSPMAGVVRASMEGTRSFSHSPLRITKPSRAAFERAVVAQTNNLKRGLWVLSAIGWTSPVAGLITALAPSARHGSGAPFPLMFGLAIAIPAIWLSRGLSFQVDSLLFEAERMSLSIIDQMADLPDGTFDNHPAFRHHSAP